MNYLKNFKALLTLMLAFSVLVSCNIEKEESGEMPDMDVDVDADFDEGEMPEYDVNWADIDVGTTTKTVEVPKVVIVMEEEEIEVPSIDFDMPDDEDGEKMERTLMIEAEVTGNEHDIEIKEIWATGRRLNVIAALEEMDTSIGDKKMRISDQISLNAPDLDVRYFIVGERPDRVFNSKYTYVKSMDELEDRIGNHEVIFRR